MSEFLRRTAASLWHPSPEAVDGVPWADIVEYSETHDLLSKRLYVVLTTPTDGLGPVMEHLDAHIEYQTTLEDDGVMFAAGPLSDAAETHWNGDGMFVYRAASMKEARAYADADPMHASGARSYRIRPWLLNTGTISVRPFRPFYSGGRVE
jgi:uncharacterized protein YciI